MSTLAQNESVASSSTKPQKAISKNKIPGKSDNNLSDNNLVDNLVDNCLSDNNLADNLADTVLTEKCGGSKSKVLEGDVGRLSSDEINVEIRNADQKIETIPEGMIWDIRSDVFTDIFSWLSTKDKMTVSHVCRDFYDRIVSDPDWPAQYEAAMLLPTVRKVFGALRQNRDNMQQVVATLRRLRIRHAFQG